MMLKQIILIQKFYKKRYFNKVCLPILLNYYNLKINFNQYNELIKKNKCFGNQCLRCNSWYFTHVIYLCLNCYKRKCYDCSDFRKNCCYGTIAFFLNNGHKRLHYSTKKLFNVIKIQLWYKKIYFRNITIPKLWLMYENMIKIKYHPDNIINFINFDPTSED